MSWSRDLAGGLALRLLEPHHAEDLYAVVDANRAHLGGWMSWVEHTRSVEDARKYAVESLRNFAERKAIAVTILKHGKIVGNTGWFNWTESRSGSGSMEIASADIGYWLAQEACGQSIATRSTVALTQLGFAEYGLRRMIITAEPDNPASWRVAERAGYAYEGTLRGVAHWKGRRIDHKLYAACADHWHAPEDAIVGSAPGGGS
ncbi:MAG: GNAT family protein [Planctomycetota bacterium]